MTIIDALSVLGTLATIAQKRGDRATLSDIAKCERRIKVIERGMNRYDRTGRGYRPETGQRLLDVQFQIIEILKSKLKK